ncbi:unnamed protein product [Periconia digitata]|uniref:Uncharacterized protein n=1 Tax=Periconia digitata TaxID=1303443 RepID=A0A9W4U352_9PLEO|nr:unnamed protein product [Periconia digitata]
MEHEQSPGPGDPTDELLIKGGKLFAKISKGENIPDGDLPVVAQFMKTLFGFENAPPTNIVRKINESTNELKKPVYMSAYLWKFGKEESILVKRKRKRNEGDDGDADRTKDDKWERENRELMKAIAAHARLVDEQLKQMRQSN